MSLIDSSDSILMLYSYSGFPERSFFVFAKSGDSDMTKEHAGHEMSNVPVPALGKISDKEGGNKENDPQDRKDDDQNKLPQEPAHSMAPQGDANDNAMARDARVKMNVMSGLSIILTLMSILVAFRYERLTLSDDRIMMTTGS